LRIAETICQVIETHHLLQQKRRMKFNEFCHRICDGLYDPRFPMEDQCSGYHQLRNVVLNKIPPHPLEIKDWLDDPESPPPQERYLRALHPKLRKFVIDNWDKIKELEVD
jgi:hypothetical protein